MDTLTKTLTPIEKLILKYENTLRDMIETQEILEDLYKIYREEN